MGVIQVLFLALACLSGAWGQTYVLVDNPVDSAASSNNCMVSSGFCNIRSAFQRCHTLPTKSVCIVTFLKSLNVIMNPTFGAITFASSSTDLTVRLIGNDTEVSPSGPMQFLSITYVSNYKLSIYDVTFRGFMIRNSVGGCLRLDNIAQANVVNARFVNNSAQNGGAIHLNLVSSVFIRDSSFVANRAAYSTQANGGAIFFSFSNKNISVLENSFLNNSAVTSGGAVHFDISNANSRIIRSRFNSNKASIGGAVGFSSNNVYATIVETNFTDNFASNAGGGLYFSFGSNSPSVVRCIFSSNSATNSGGAISAQYANTVLIRDTIIANNDAKIYGGGIHFLTSNSVSKLEGCTLTDNYASYGGGLYVQTTNDLAIVSSKFISNIASVNGGAIAFSINCYYQSILNSTFSFNAAKTGGAVIFDGASYFGAVKNSTFLGNTAEKGGAMMFNSGNAIIDVIDSSFVKNTADIEGGAMFFFFQNILINVRLSSFSENSAGEGGAVYLYDGNTDILYDNCHFSENMAMESGGALFLSANNMRFHVQSSWLYNNIASTHGGAITLVYKNYNTSFDTVLFYGNSASFSGGAIYSVLENNGLTIEGSSMHLNIAGSDAGAIYIGSDHLHIRIMNNILQDNTASNVAGIYISLFTSDVVIFNSSFISNKGSNFHSIHSFANDLEISFCKFTDHSYLYEGSVISLTGVGIGIQGCEFKFNDITSLKIIESKNVNLTQNLFYRGLQENIFSSGALDIFSSSDVTIENSEFIDCATAGSGGAIKMQSAFNIFLLNLLFDKNTAVENGGSIMMMYSLVTIGNVTFRENYANRGGALYSNNVGFLEIYDSIFFGNAAISTSGGAIHLHKSGSTIKGNKFMENVATTAGGAVFWEIRSYMDEPIGLLDSNLMQTNKATYGNDVATEGFSTHITMMQSNDTYSTPYFNAVTKEYEYIVVVFETPLPPIKIQLLDYYGSLVLSDSDSFSSVKVTEQHCSSEEGFITGDVVELSELGEILFNLLEPNCFPGGNTRITFETPQIYDETIIITYNDEFRLSFRTCIRGEYYTNGNCVMCPDGTYSFLSNEDNSVTECSTCPSEAKSCFGDNIEVSSGYWRISENSSEILKCLVTSDGCTGGWATGDESCAEGYEGPLCSVCSNNYYFSSATLKCTSCISTSNVNPIGIASMGIIIFFSLFAAYFFVKRKNKKDNLSIDDILASILTNVGLPSAAHSIKNSIRNNRKKFIIKLKIYLTLYQIFSAMTYVLDFNFPIAFNSILSALNLLNMNTANELGISCSTSYDHIDILLVVTIFPIIFSILLYVVYNCHVLWFRDNSGTRNSLKYSYFYGFLFFTYMIFPGVSTVIFRTFSCQDVDGDDVYPGDDYYLRADYSISCSSDRYSFGLVWASIMLLVYPLGIPISYYLLLRNVKDYIVNRNSENFSVANSAENISEKLMPLTFLFEAYLPQYWYWEVIETLQRLMLTGILVCILPGSNIQIVIAILFSILFLKAYEYCSPYADESIGINKIIAQGQYFSFFFLILILKEDIVGNVDGILIVLLLVLTLFANLIYDLFAFSRHIYVFSTKGSASRNIETITVVEMPTRMLSSEF